MSKAVKSFFGGTPKLPKQEKVPTIADPSVQQAAEAQRLAAATAAGRGSTILTSGLGDKSTASTLKQTLG